MWFQGRSALSSPPDDGEGPAISGYYLRPSTKISIGWASDCAACYCRRRRWQALWQEVSQPPDPSSGWAAMATSAATREPCSCAARLRPICPRTPTSRSSGSASTKPTAKASATSSARVWATRAYAGRDWQRPALCPAVSA